ncbi:hypothetical protein [Ruminococcus sp. FC2018]|uniref:hypothetical protein n=1 Tax=Ruminococcus sp. FC2018 TaxID=1410617 RepID=UPI00048BBC62|nr:hypothetical protein [Ruminococcus sp. FC2018]
MKKRCFALSVLIMICAVLFVGCGEEKYELDGVDVSNIQVDLVRGSDATFKFDVKNSSDESVSFDAGKFTLKLDGDDNKIIRFMGGKETIDADSKDTVSYLVYENHPEMKEDDTVKVYFDDKEICEVKVGKIEL